MGAVYLILRKQARILCLCVLPLLAIGIALSLSRLGLVAMVAGILVLLGAFRHRRLLRVVGAVTLAIVGLVLFSKAFPDVLQLYVQRTLSAFTGDSAQDARYDAWDIAFDTIRNSPLGVGIGTAGGKVNPESQVAVSESTFLKLGIELGVVAVIGFLGLYLFALRRTLLAARELSLMDDRVELRLDLAFLAALVFATLINHAFVQAIEYFSYGPISMIVLGMALNVRVERSSRGTVVKLCGVAQ
jgi:O-antigen ligase